MLVGLELGLRDGAFRVRLGVLPPLAALVGACASVDELGGDVDAELTLAAGAVLVCAGDLGLRVDLGEAEPLEGIPLPLRVIERQQVYVVCGR
ncbi:MAG: hypothetical protein WAU77_00890 [Solirubrobacteraceae bacterium]